MTKQKQKLKPGQPGYEWAQHYPEGSDLYLHTFPGGQQVGILSFKAIYSKTWMFKIRKLSSDLEVEFAALERAACPEALAVLETLSDEHGDPVDDLWEAWVADGSGGLTPGE